MTPFIVVTPYPPQYDEKGDVIKESVMIAHILTVVDQRPFAESGFFSSSWLYVGKIFLNGATVTCCENRKQIEQLIIEAHK